MKKSNWLLFVTMVLVSCLEEPECFNLDNNIIGFSYKILGSSASATLSFSGITTSSTDSIVFNGDFSGQTFSIPLDLFREHMTLYFQGIDKTMQLGYAIKSQFVSEDCGPRFVLSDLRVLSHNFDSVRVIQPVPGSSSAARNIEIYACPQTNYTTIAFFQLYNKTRASDPLSLSFAEIFADYVPDSAYYTSATASSVTLPLNLQSDATTFTFNDGFNSDNLQLSYRRTVEERFKLCKVQTFIDSLKISDFTFDSVSIARDNNLGLLHAVSDPPVTNVNIYRCPETNLVQIAFRKPVAGDSTRTIANPVSLVRIRADYTTTAFYENVQDISTVVLPLNPASDTTIFYFDYADRTETVALTYLRQNQTIFNACGQQPVFSRLKEAIDLPNVNILENDSITYPVVTNLEILP